MNGSVWSARTWVCIPTIPFLAFARTGCARARFGGAGREKWHYVPTHVHSATRRKQAGPFGCPHPEACMPAILLVLADATASCSGKRRSSIARHVTESSASPAFILRSRRVALLPALDHTALVNLCYFLLGRRPKRSFKRHRRSRDAASSSLAVE